MERKLRKTGIDALGDTPWGMHVCHFYKTQNDLTDVLLPYFEAGLENNEFCMLVTSQPLQPEDAKLALREKVKNLDHYLEKKQLMILDSHRWYAKSGKLELHKVLTSWIEKEKEALENGFDGLRVAGNASWLDSTEWKAKIEYEAMVDYAIGSHKTLAICSYSIDKCDINQLIKVASRHHFTLTKESGKWTRLSRVCYSQQ